jgi:hypothetical protein
VPCVVEGRRASGGQSLKALKAGGETKNDHEAGQPEAAPPKEACAGSEDGETKQVANIIRCDEALQRILGAEAAPQDEAASGDA